MNSNKRDELERAPEEISAFVILREYLEFFAKHPIEFVKIWPNLSFIISLVFFVISLFLIGRVEKAWAIVVIFFVPVLLSLTINSLFMQMIAHMKFGKSLRQFMDDRRGLKNV